MPRTPVSPSVNSDPYAFPVEILTIAALHPHPRNDGQHPVEELAHLKQSIQTHGIYRNVVVAEDGTILAGHGVIVAAQELGYTLVPGRRMSYGPDDPRALQLLIGDNHIAQLRIQDDATLAALLADLAVTDPLTLLGTGYDEEAVAALLAQQGLGAGSNETGGRDVESQIDHAEELRQKWTTEVGQMWALGEHRLICGNCTDKVIVKSLLKEKNPAIILADPPYGMGLDTTYANSHDNPGKGAIKSRGYAPIIGDDIPFDPRPIMELCTGVAEQFWWGADYYRQWLPTGGSWLAWDKRASVETVEYSSSEFELCWSRIAHHRKLLRVPWFGFIGTEQQDSCRRLHPTQKPLGIVNPLLEQYTTENDLVFDPYLGSGTTLIACEQLHRRCYGCEIDPGYVAVTLQRYVDITGALPTLMT